MKKMIVIGILVILFIVGCKITPEVEEEYCVDKETGASLSLSEAKEIAAASECGDRLKDTYMCNEDTGTWWINLDIVKEMCNPACVVNVNTKEAVINWRCMGLVE